jgi:hypothetical protein
MTAGMEEHIRKAIADSVSACEVGGYRVAPLLVEIDALRSRLAERDARVVELEAQTNKDVVRMTVLGVSEIICSERAERAEQALAAKGKLLEDAQRWIDHHNARADAADAQVARLKAAIETIDMQTLHESYDEGAFALVNRAELDNALTVIETTPGAADSGGTR